MPHQPPQPCGLPKKQIYTIAQQVAEQLDYEPGDELEPLIAAIGGNIHRVGAADLSDTIDGSIEVHDIANFDIYLADDVGPLRERFTLAHELGHYCLHYQPEEGPMSAARYGSDRTEWEANWFAAGFLMPEEKFQQEFERLDGNISAISSSFKVSVQAAEIHAEYLGLLR